MHFGADRMLVIGVRDEQPDPEPAADVAAVEPTFAQLAGYMLDTLFMDGLYTDLERISRTNRSSSSSARGSSAGSLAELRPIQTLVIVPKEDIRDVAARYAHELPRPVRLLLRGLGARPQERPAARELPAVRIRASRAR